MATRYAWFGTWVDQNLLLTFTAVSVSDPSHVLGALRATRSDGDGLSWSEAREIDAPIVRIGTTGGWAYTVEHASTVGSDPAVLERLTANGALGMSLCFTDAISTVHVARNGEHLTGFEAADPDFVRWGSAPNTFDPQIAAAGWADLRDERPAAACARFLHLVTGLDLTAAMLEAPLPYATLPV
jgi:hypothetical protein